LYDNALLTVAYLEAVQVTGREDFRQMARETLDYVLREMTHPDGAFCSTQDADSEGVEGKFFVWTKEEIESLLEENAARRFCEAYDVTPGGNWEGHTILNLPRPIAAVARDLGISTEELQQSLAASRQILLEARSQRVHPGQDDKIITAWNGLMLTALARGSRVLRDPAYAAAAERAAGFILSTMRRSDGRLVHSWRNGQGSTVACLDDLACMIDGLTELYEATFEPQYLAAALELAGQMQEHHTDPESGGFFYTAREVESLIARTRDSQDTATPSGNSMAALALVRLGRLTGRQDLEDAAARVLESVSGQVAQVPQASGQALIALDFQLGPVQELVFAGESPADVITAVQAASAKFRPRAVTAVRPAGLSDEELPPFLQPLLNSRHANGAAASLWLCTNGTCDLPVHGLEAIGQKLA
ncbi:MAG: thioredoxin domain-containing protein, partial [Planctomycetaceae bacterium]|nr:thioredoxin domain-containing protein [Planctomycetaceae bacterium]